MNILLELLGMLFVFILISLLKRDENGLMAEQEQSVKKQIKIYCEKIDGIHYAWLMPNNEFIGQSPHPNEVAKLLMQKFPSKDYNLIIEEKV